MHLYNARQRFDSIIFTRITDIERRPRTRIPPHVMALSAMELQMRVFEFCLSHA